MSTTDFTQEELAYAAEYEVSIAADAVFFPTQTISTTAIPTSSVSALCISTDLTAIETSRTAPRDSIVSFHKFTDLLVEIERKIWGYVYDNCIDGRVVLFDYADRTQPYLFIPPISVCKASRQAIVDKYTILFNTGVSFGGLGVGQAFKISANYDKDIICIMGLFSENLLPEVFGFTETGYLMSNTLL